MSPRRLGQHFLANAAWRARILDRLAPARDQVWLEIGAGRGEMTRELAARARSVVAIEVDAALAETLRERTAGLPVKIVRGDILSLDLIELAGPRFHVYGSLPYYITSPIVRKLFLTAGHIDSINVVIQWEVARRITAKPGSRDYGWLSVLAQFHTRPEIVLRIPPGAFRPPPKVDSALVRMTPPGESARLKLEDETGFLEFAQISFGQKRKTLVNNLKTRYGAQAARQALETLGCGAQVRAEELRLAELAELFRILEGREGR